jgi:signal transduction histidine kinase/ActR/RegA family two-component response regulator
MSARVRSSVRLLVIDRSEELCAALRSLLHGRLDVECALEWTGGLAAGLEALEARRHDVCAVEHALDLEHGSALTRAAVECGIPPVALLAGRRSLAVEAQVLEAGAADFLWKEELSAPLVESVVRHALDVRDRARLERQLHLAQRMETVGRLAGGVAHEFNNILTAIVGFGTLVADEVAGHDAAAAHVREILRGAERAGTLTRDLLAFSRRQVLRPAPVDLAEVVEHLARMLRGVLGSSVDLQLRCTRVPKILADRAQIEQAVTNLAINARDAMPKGGRLTIEVDETTLDERYCDSHVSASPGRHVRLCVSDTGVGIPRELLPRVFEPFFTTRDPAASSGLGLSTTYGIVKQSGGNIWAYSEPGLGTTFKLYFPVAAGAGRAHEPAGASAGERLRGSETILLVDDTDMVRRLARDVLSGAGYRVLEAAGADEALQVAGSEASPIDLLVTDVVMPGRSGMELADRLRTARHDVRVLYISGYTDAAIVRGGLLAENAAFLQKPFTPDDLLRKVRQVLEPASPGPV